MMAVLHPGMLIVISISVFVCYLLAMRYDPMRLSGRMTVRLAYAASVIGAWNMLLPAQHLGVNSVTLMLSGWLGIPGAALCAFLQII